jgi:hypothetical protein
VFVLLLAFLSAFAFFSPLHAFCFAMLYCTNACFPSFLEITVCFRCSTCLSTSLIRPIEYKTCCMSTARATLSPYRIAIMHVRSKTVTYDHRILKIELPVRSAVLKQYTGGLVVRWVTTGEYPLLYVFGFFFRGNVRQDPPDRTHLREGSRSWPFNIADIQ